MAPAARSASVPGSGVGAGKASAKTVPYPLPPFKDGLPPHSVIPNNVSQIKGGYSAAAPEAKERSS